MTAAEVFAFVLHMGSHAFSAFAGAYFYKFYAKPFFDEIKRQNTSFINTIYRERAELERLAARLAPSDKRLRADDGRFISRSIFRE